jgi:hypothetical protein
VKPGDTENAGGGRWWEHYIKLDSIGIAYGKVHKLKKKNLEATSIFYGDLQQVPL